MAYQGLRILKNFRAKHQEHDGRRVPLVVPSKRRVVGHNVFERVRTRWIEGGTLSQTS